MIEERKPKVIGIDRSTVFAFSDGLSSGELQGMSEALGPTWTATFRDAERLPLELIASRLPEEEAFFEKMTALVWQMTQTMFSDKAIVPGTTRTSDLVWWWRQRTNDQGLGTWFQPSIEVQRKGVTAKELGADPIIQPGDVLHCDVGITVARLNTDTQHMAYVLRPARPTRRPVSSARSRTRTRCRTIAMEEIRPGRTGNEILRLGAVAHEGEGDHGTMYSHPIGMNGHGAGPLIGLWDYQDGVARPRRREGDSVDVVLDRAAGDDAGAGMGRTAGADGAGRRHDRRRRRQAALGAPATGSVVPRQEPLTRSLKG